MWSNHREVPLDCDGILATRWHVCQVHQVKLASGGPVGTATSILAMTDAIADKVYATPTYIFGGQHANS